MCVCVLYNLHYIIHISICLVILSIILYYNIDFTLYYSY